MKLTPADLKAIKQVAEEVVDKKLQYVPTEKQLDYIEQRLKQAFVTNEKFDQFRSDIFEKLDGLIKMMRDMRQEQIIEIHQFQELEDRVEVLEAVRIP